MAIEELSDADREYLVMMYEEHAEHARQHETLRAAVTGLMIALIAGLLALAVDASKQWVAGVLVCAVSLLGVILNHKHYERYDLHLHVLRSYRKAFEAAVSAKLTAINASCRKDHENKYKFTHRWLRLHVLWLVIYAITFVAGALLTIGATPPGFLHSNEAHKVP